MKTSVVTSFLLCVVAATSIDGVRGLAASHNNPQRTTTTTAPQRSLSRGAFLSNAAAAAAAVAFVAATPTTSAAAGIRDANLQNYEEPTNARTCYDRCLYECVKKDKKDQGACETTCSEKCATAEGQLTSNTPPTKKGSETSK